MDRTNYRGYGQQRPYERDQGYRPRDDGYQGYKQRDEDFRRPNQGDDRRRFDDRDRQSFGDDYRSSQPRRELNDRDRNFNKGPEHYDMPRSYHRQEFDEPRDQNSSRPRPNHERPQYSGGQYESSRDRYPESRDQRGPRQSGTFRERERDYGHQDRPQPSSHRADPETSLKPYQKQGFGSRPAASNGRSMVVASAAPQNVSVVSNQYLLKIQGNIPVFQYRLEIKGMEMWDPNLVERIMKLKRAALEKALGFFFFSGQSIYVIAELDQDVHFDVQAQNLRYKIMITQSTQSSLTLDDKFENSENTVRQAMINIIIKQAFRETDLKQIGKVPRFFDTKSMIELERSKIRILSGFKASAFQSQLGCTLVVDSIFKFMSTTSCLQRMLELKQMNPQDNTHRWQQRCRLEFTDKSIIADWGNQRQYFVRDLDFDKNPMTESFEYQGQQTTIAEYFLRCYGKKITHPEQPMFLVKIAEKDYYLPTEFCLLDGISDSVRKGPGMRDALAQTRINPQEKTKRIHDMVQTLMSQKAMKDWNIVIEEQPVSMQTCVLGLPQITVSQNQVINCDENVLRRQAISNPTDFLRDQWIIVCERRNMPLAQNVFRDMQKASGQLKLKVEEPYWIELQRESDSKDLDKRLCDYMMGGSRIQHPRILVCVLQHESSYQQVKEVTHSYRIPSQVITVRNASKFNLSKATNILKQMNSKSGGDLYYLKFPEVLDQKRTMLIGIDVCHAGPQSVVGFSASINPQMSQYFSDYIVQRKGQEIVKDHMKKSMVEAIMAFKANHQGKPPTTIVIYRDGVGDAMRNQVLSHEIPQFETAINAIYGEEAKPEICVVVVNKRISQRFFVKDHNGNLSNPPPGCIIDTDLVEHSDEATGKFDFFLTPSSANQGCVLPTHFFVPKNSSSLKKIEIEHLTYALCYYYFNWAGPIKVPAPCQYAHKIAEFYMNIGAAKKSRCAYQAHPSVLKEVERAVEPLNNRLHFL